MTSSGKKSIFFFILLMLGFDAKPRGEHIDKNLLWTEMLKMIQRMAFNDAAVGSLTVLSLIISF